MSIIKTCFNNNEYFDNKNILITGGTGTIGNILTEYFLNNTKIHKVCIFSRDEFKQYNMKNKFKNNDNYEKMRFFLGDVRDEKRISHSLRGIDIVIHAAALKQVDTIEYNPMEAINTNIIGTNNVIQGCINNNVSQLIGISTDKCVSPVNLYGGTKLCLEKLITNAYEYTGYALKTCVLRYGNVVSSRGSVIPVFKEQKDSGVFTVTNKDMTRFTLTIDEALNFVINCITISCGGEIFVPVLPKYKIMDICRLINPDNEIKEIGVRPGEKIHEEMIAEAESLNVYKNDDFFIVKSSTINEELKTKFNLIKNEQYFTYSSKNAIQIEDIELLKQINI